MVLASYYFSLNISAISIIYGSKLGMWFYFNTFAENKPDDAIDLSKRASEMIKLKRYSDAIGLLNSAMKADPYHSDAYQLRATAFRQICKYVCAINILNYLKLIFFRMSWTTNAIERDFSYIYSMSLLLQ